MDAHRGDRETDAATRQISRVAALIVGAAVIVIPYACSRAYRRWLSRNDPFEALNASLDRLAIRYRERGEVIRAFGEMGRGAMTRSR